MTHSISQLAVSDVVSIADVQLSVVATWPGRLQSRLELLSDWQPPS